MAGDYLTRLSASTGTFLSRWQDANVTLRELTVSLRILSIVLYWTHEDLTSRNLCIYVSDPLWMEGPFSWSHSAMTVSVAQVADTEALGRTSYDYVLELSDRAAGFKLLADSIEVKENVRLR